MRSRRIWLIAALLVLAGSALFAAPRVWNWFEAPPAGYCPICLRHEHKESMVKFQAEGERAGQACCLSCALTYGRQVHKKVTILAVTDHGSGKDLAPEQATFVVGSDVSPCTHTMMHMGAEKQEYPVHWDRCLPSILAFPSVDAADAFRAEHGGRLRSLKELIEQATSSNKPLE
ncbi:MAG: hypothetical protein ACHQ9S_10870 [Candidatus Binatia bacterium]